MERKTSYRVAATFGISVVVFAVTIFLATGYPQHLLFPPHVAATVPTPTFQEWLATRVSLMSDADLASYYDNTGCRDILHAAHNGHTEEVTRYCFLLDNEVHARQEKGGRW